MRDLADERGISSYSTGSLLDSDFGGSCEYTSIIMHEHSYTRAFMINIQKRISIIHIWLYDKYIDMYIKH